MTTLSERFSQLSKNQKPLGQQKPKVNVKIQQKAMDSKSKRQSNTAQRRGIKSDNVNNNRTPKKVIVGKVSVGNKKNGNTFTQIYVMMLGI